jgi:uncharacterized OsmC-like protein
MSRPVTVMSLGGFKTEARVAGHRLVLDEPPEHGGEDAGPTPVETLLAALGA